MGGTRTIPMIGGDGGFYDLPPEKVPDAVKSGMKIGVNVTGSDGTPYTVPIEKYGDFMQHRNQETQAAPPPQGNQFQRQFDASVKTDPNEPLALTGLKSVASGIAAPFVHPANALHSAIGMFGMLPNKYTPSNRDLAQPILDDYAQGGAMYAGTKVAGNLAGQALLGKVAGAGIARAMPVAGAAAVTPEEVSARTIAKAVNPPSPAYPQYLEAAKDQLGTVLDYAKRKGLSLTAAGDKYVGPSLSKLAGGAKEETAAHYEGNVLGPHETIRPGGVNQGVLAGTDPTLRQIDGRITDIAAEQQSANRQPTPGQVTGRSDLELASEKAHLSDILHRSLGDLTGMGAEDVQGLRQRMAQLGVLSGETQGAANAVTRTAGIQNNAGGSAFPLPTAHGVWQHILSNIPGFDPETLQGKAIIKAINKIPETSTMRNGNALPATFDGPRTEALASTAKSVVSKSLQAQATRKAIMNGTLSRYLDAPDIGGNGNR